MRLPDDPSPSAQINIVPMIDVIFAILSFFIIATLFLNRSDALPVNLPQAKTVKPQLSTKVTVTIDAQGDLALNREPIQLNVLEAEVKELTDSADKVVVVIHADDQVSHGRVVTVMDRIREIEGAKLAIAATKKP
ncbi:ExbD/TolR family protein [Acaryochloris marina]|uniref:Biopolymer transport protein ExbD/TolR, putative n=1 Tax=Acaryochloris marina (strain MBIC 11017) TaxID=329726 RepID=A8ZM77_ACAM1|nr:biopolymer transporter ExbD [Acaryochloris marina]ABW31846.1 biopolymer transport protein ExbD/TolR, putative [Acaryochloris marina MBIC11017]BDM82977.1 biopolymer transporter ExbD [Acaryochloris marina MBIC10699]